MTREDKLNELTALRTATYPLSVATAREVFDDVRLVHADGRTVAAVLDRIDDEQFGYRRAQSSTPYYPGDGVWRAGPVRTRGLVDTVRLKHKTGIPVTAPRWQSSAQRIRLQSGTPAGSNPALGFSFRTLRPGATRARHRISEWRCYRTSRVSKSR